MPLAIFIATTSGPVEVQRITEEDPEIDSVVCLAGKAMPLPISHAYQDFVRQSSGIIQRDFGHGSYRVDLSGTIEDGYSWQLGLYLAHAAAAAGRLASKDTAGDHVVFATGEVDIDRAVLSVEHIPLKLERLRAKAEECAAAGAEVTVLIPAGATESLPTDWEGRVDIRAVADTAAALDALGLATPSSRSTPPPTLVADPPVPTPIGRRLKRFGVLAIGLAAIALFAAYSFVMRTAEPWDALAREGRFRDLDAALSKAGDGDLVSRFAAAMYRKSLSVKRPSNSDIAIRLIEHRAPPDKTCAAVRFGAAAAIPVEAKRTTERAFAPSHFDGLCALEIIAEADDDTTYLWGRFSRWPAGSRILSDAIELGPSRQRLHWKIDLPRRLREAFDMRVVVVAGDRPIDGTSGWVSGKVPPARGTESAADWRERVDALAERGILMTDASLKLAR